MAYVYTHTRLDKNEVFYVGIGKDSNGKYSRAKESNKRNDHWKRISKKTKWTVEIVADNVSWYEACVIEAYLIMFFGRKDLFRGRLCNLTNGGDGGGGRIKSVDEIEKLRLCNIGRKHTPETLEKMRIARMGRKLSAKHVEKIRKNSTGRFHTEVAKSKISATKKSVKVVRSQEWIAKWRLSMVGKKQSKEHIEKRRLKAIGRKNSPEAIEKTRLANIGKKMSEESKRKMSLAKKGKKLSPEHIEKVRLTSLGRRHSLATIEKMKMNWDIKRLHKNLPTPQLVLW